MMVNSGLRAHDITMSQGLCRAKVIRQWAHDLRIKRHTLIQEASTAFHLVPFARAGLTEYSSVSQRAT
jgi:hypothetical protein